MSTSNAPRFWLLFNLRFVFCKKSFSSLHLIYRAIYEPLRSFGNDDSSCSTRVQCVLPPTTGWIPCLSALVDNMRDTRVEHSCRACCIVISKNSQGLVTRSVLAVQKVLSGSGRAGRLHLMGKYTCHRLVARPELDNTF